MLFNSIEFLLFLPTIFILYWFVFNRNFKVQNSLILVSSYVFYSWWDYRAAGFERNRGWRIDHHYLSLPLSQKATSCTIDKSPRQLTKPSDHAPVIVEF